MRIRTGPCTRPPPGTISFNRSSEVRPNPPLNPTAGILRDTVRKEFASPAQPGHRTGRRGSNVPYDTWGGALTSPVWPFGQHAAIGYLRDLLATPGQPYRARWARHARRRLAPGEINAMAVARFLAEERSVWHDGATAHQVKDTVHRALTGDNDRQLLTPETLTRFATGFELTEDQENRLRALLAGDDPDQARPV